MGGGAEAVLRRVGSHADGWIPFSRSATSVQNAKAGLERIKAYAAEAGRDAGNLGAEGRVWVNSGGPDAWRERYETFRDMGFTNVSINTMETGYTTHGPAPRRPPPLPRDRSVSAAALLKRAARIPGVMKRLPSAADDTLAAQRDALPESFEALSAIEPSLKPVDYHKTSVLELDKRVRSNASESRALAAQRVALLPRLQSGKCTFSFRSNRTDGDEPI